MCSTYIFLGLITERFLALSKPHKYFASGTGKASSWKKISRYTLPVFAFSLIFHIPSFFEIEFGDFFIPAINRTSNWRFTELRNNKSYILVYKNICRVIFRGILPFLTLLFANYKLIVAARNLKKMLPDAARIKSFRIKQAHGLIVIVTVNFVNFFLYCAKKMYLLFFLSPQTSLECKIGPSLFSVVVESAQVIIIT
jgi:hypothetical protein